MNLEKYIDHTLLKPTATQEEIKTLCKEAQEYNFYAVCVNGSHVNFCKEILRETDIKIAAVISFPLGAMTTKAKIFEAEECLKNGADEIDMVINIGWLKSGEIDKVTSEIRDLKKSIGDKVLKVIIETCYLTDEEKKIACKAAVDAKADYVKTSTGFGSNGANIQDIILMSLAVAGKAKIKASGGIRDAITTKEYISLGVSRIGTSSGIKIVKMQ